MMKIPSKIKKAIGLELKRFFPVIKNLKSRGTGTSEDDSRIVLNDILNDVLGYDKYTELRTEQREKAGRLDYVLKLTEGPYASKKDKIDCVVEAKAVHHDLAPKYVDQTLTYCLTTNTKYFILTNVRQWHLYEIKPAQKETRPTAELIHEVDLTQLNNIETLAEEFYILSRASYLAGNWKNVATLKQATNVNDIFTILLSQKAIKLVTKLLSEIHGVRIPEELVGEIIETQLGDDQKLKVNRTLLKRLNASGETKKRPTAKASQPRAEAEPTEATVVPLFDQET